MRAVELFGIAIIAMCVLAVGLITYEVFWMTDLGIDILDSEAILGLPLYALMGVVITVLARWEPGQPAAAQQAAMQPTQQAAAQPMHDAGSLTSQSHHSPADFPSAPGRPVFWFGISGVMLGVFVLLACLASDIAAGDLDLVLYSFGLRDSPIDYNSGTEPPATVLGLWAALVFSLPGALVAVLAGSSRRPTAAPVAVGQGAAPRHLADRTVDR